MATTEIHPFDPEIESVSAQPAQSAQHAQKDFSDTKTVKVTLEST